VEGKIRVAYDFPETGSDPDEAFADGQLEVIDEDIEFSAVEPHEYSDAFR